MASSVNKRMAGMKYQRSALKKKMTAAGVKHQHHGESEISSGSHRRIKRQQQRQAWLAAAYQHRNKRFDNGGISMAKERSENQCISAKKKQRQQRRGINGSHGVNNQRSAKKTQ